VAIRSFEAGGLTQCFGADAAARDRKLSALRLYIEFDGKPADQIFET
jgi:hypothetical protein